ncbi:MAG: AAA family ATPase, partial [Candidatus Binatia bacterium]
MGREAELTRLHQLYIKALGGERQMVFVTGEAGIGKTTLIETFLEQVPSSRFQVPSPQSAIRNRKLFWPAWRAIVSP